MHKNCFVRLVVSGLVLSLAVLFGMAAPSEAAGRTGITLSASAGNGSFTAAVTIPPTTSATVALFGDGLTALRGLAPGKPIMTSETASGEAGGSKADWNTALVSYLAAQSDVTALVWFHHNKEVDRRINGSTASTNALAAALAARTQ